MGENMLLTLILTSVFLGALGQIFLKIGANQLKTFSLSLDKIISTFFKVIFTPYVFLGLIFFGLSFFLWVKVLTQAELSYAYPLVSLSYVIVSLASWLFFKEGLSLGRVSGLFFIILGVSLIVRS